MVARTLELLAALQLQRWEYCHRLGLDADPAHLLRAVNMAEPASRAWAVSINPSLALNLWTFSTRIQIY